MGMKFDLMTKLKRQMSGSVSDNNEKTTHVTSKFMCFYFVSPIDELRYYLLTQYTVLFN